MSTSAPKTFDYAAFIDRIRELLLTPHYSGKPGVPFNAKNPGFVEWKQKVTYAIAQIEERGYKIHCDIRTRSFHPNWVGRGTDAERTQRVADYFQRALHETDVELQTIVEHFDNFGAPLLNGQQDVQIPKVFDYKAFIDELTVLRDSFANPPPNHRNASSPSFKQWRHALIDLIGRIRQHGYDINCRIEVRRFQSNPYPSLSPREQQANFENALTETMIELNTIISNFEKYGDPKSQHQASLLVTTASTGAGTGAGRATTGSAETGAEITKESEWNKDATIAWFIRKMPVGTLIAVLGSYVAVAVAGFGIGKWTAVLEKPAVETSSTAQKPSQPLGQPTSNSRQGLGVDNSKPQQPTGIPGIPANTGTAANAGTAGIPSNTSQPASAASK